MTTGSMTNRVVGDEATATASVERDDPAVLGWSKEQPAEGRYVETDQGFMVPYQQTIPGTDITFTMQPIPGGTFRLGSSEEEEGRNDDEGPQVEIEVAPFWIGQHEVTWAEYKHYMGLYSGLKSLQYTRKLLASTTDNPRVKTQREKLEPIVAQYDALKAYLSEPADELDAVTIPTPLYDSSATYESGEDPGQPAVTMKQYAAKQYTKWLSLLGGVEYRLPTEAEWEYACRAGSTTPYSYGDDPETLGDYAWYEANSDGKTHEVGQKKPNAWGLFDMHGNAMEWVLDAYAESGYDHLDAGSKHSAMAAVRWPTEAYPRVLRGGHWDSAAEECRSAARVGTDDMGMSDSDPNVPRSPWWFTDYPAGAVGFRIVRQMKPLTEEDRARMWDADVESLRNDVETRISEGRGLAEGVPPNQPEILQQIENVNQAK
jgi:formylglycine-generating enzyme required for sulfatase activity